MTELLARPRFYELAERRVWVTHVIGTNIPTFIGTDQTRSFSIHGDYASGDEALPGEYAPPDGRMLLATSSAEAAGCAAFHRMTPDICGDRLKRSGATKWSTSACEGG